MGKIHHSEPTSSLARFFVSFVLIFAIVTSSSATSGCSRFSKGNQPASSAPIADLNIVPRPGLLQATNSGFFEFSSRTKIFAADVGSERVGKGLNILLEERYGFKLDVTDTKNQQNTVSLALDQSQGDEAYTLTIEPDSVRITGSERGMYYACQSLLQMFPVDFTNETRIPSAIIRDAPRFRYRGMHLDVARHFMPAAYIKQYIRLIARYKYNYFHWHLTDDQGWRIEIKKHPQLTAVGSKRPETVLGMNFPRVYLPPDPYRGYIGDNQPVEGYYSQEEIRDIVQFAKDHYVTIIPEIEMPGHASAALASYPSLGCLERYPYKVQTTWGAFADIFCPTEPTFRFLEDVLTEVIDLFPDSPYVHIGGDEVLRMGQWTTSRIGKEVMRSRGLANGKAVQRWFLSKVEQFVNSKGKQIIGWDDMMDAGVPPNATVMAWRMRGDKGVTWDPGFEAARRGHDVIMTPNHYTYFDHRQGNGDQSRDNIYNEVIPLEKVYSVDLIPAGLNNEEAGRIIGGEGTLWTEYIKTPAEVELMMFPRAIALAEVLWSKAADRNLGDFRKRLAKERPKLDRDRANARVSSAVGPRLAGSISRPRVTQTTPVPTVQRTSDRRVLKLPGAGGRSLAYRVSLPVDYQSSNRDYPVLYLLHGVGENENTWWEQSRLAEYTAKSPLIIVTPANPDNRSADSNSTGLYEDEIVNLLIPEIGRTYRTTPGREARAVAGNSVGGSSAVRLALRYPDEFAFAGSISGIFDTSTFQLLDQTTNGFRLPWLYVSYGTSGQTAESSQRYERLRTSLIDKAPRHTYIGRSYSNDWNFWNIELGILLGQMCDVRKIGCQ